MPQRLKPRCFLSFYGTAKAVPFQNPPFTTGCKTNCEEIAVNYEETEKHSGVEFTKVGQAGALPVQATADSHSQ